MEPESNEAELVTKDYLRTVLLIALLAMLACQLFQIFELGKSSPDDLIRPGLTLSAFLLFSLNSVSTRYLFSALFLIQGIAGLKVFLVPFINPTLLLASVFLNVLLCFGVAALLVLTAVKNVLFARQRDELVRTRILRIICLCAICLAMAYFTAIDIRNLIG